LKKLEISFDEHLSFDLATLIIVMCSILQQRPDQGIQR
jgi:hypothetical protein